MKSTLVPKKKKPGKSKQLNVRFPLELADRLEAAADMLATDPSNLLRMIVVEHLWEYEERGRKAHGRQQEGVEE
jgi:hypothetical protein